jgi:hypothetical protein
MIEEHAKRLAKVFERFKNSKLQLQPEKCAIAKDEVTYLGFELYYRGIEASPDKVKAVQNVPIPRSVKDVRSFLGLAPFYQRFDYQFADTAKPLTQVTKDKIWDWNQECQVIREIEEQIKQHPRVGIP